MKNPLHYQLSEYDCGPTSMLNAISFLFEREDIPPEIIRNIMLYSLDCYGAGGAFGKSGTSRTAMMFLSNWLDGYGQTCSLPISSSYIAGKSVYIGSESLINDTLRRHGAVVVRLHYEGEHYVLLTGEREGKILLFDPWFEEPENSSDTFGPGYSPEKPYPSEKPQASGSIIRESGSAEHAGDSRHVPEANISGQFEDSGIIVTTDHPFEYNRIIPASVFNRETHDLYALGETERREAVLLFNNRTKLTAENTIEYFI